jgi:hypothetical protein
MLVHWPVPCGKGKAKPFTAEVFLIDNDVRERHSPARSFSGYDFPSGGSGLKSLSDANRWGFLLCSFELRCWIAARATPDGFSRFDSVGRCERPAAVEHDVEAGAEARFARKFRGCVTKLSVARSPA